jgi:DUF1009 family protein
MASPSNASGSSDARVGLVAGNGALPYQVADVLAQKGITPVIVAIKGEADPDTLERSVAELGWGEIGRLLKTLKRHGCSRLLLIGGISRRPDFASVFGDAGTLRLLPKIARALMGGDDSLLSKVIGLFEAEGFEVVGMTDIAPELLAGTGVLGKVSPSKSALEDMDLAFKATEKLGELDIGQAAVAVGARVVALEGAEGTDAMLERCAALRANGRIRAKGAAGVLVKAAKPSQDLRVDLPTVGPRTIELASAAGLSGIAVEAGRALIADQEATIRKADEAGLFIYGIEHSEKR